ncbi:hypothetical protein V1477_009705 [Vespula maculifrons]|uniref:Uncharacterized protein n=1 Tax=Vespula maculifrons TaxID=7453 RepID=A0ABD2CAI3_VESMC
MKKKGGKEEEEEEEEGETRSCLEELVSFTPSAFLAWSVLVFVRCPVVDVAAVAVPTTNWLAGWLVGWLAGWLGSAVDSLEGNRDRASMSALSLKLTLKNTTTIILHCHLAKVILKLGTIIVYHNENGIEYVWLILFYTQRTVRNKNSISLTYGVRMRYYDPVDYYKYITLITRTRIFITLHYSNSC